MFRRNFLQTFACLIPTCMVGCHTSVKHEAKFEIGQIVRLSKEGQDFNKSILTYKENRNKHKDIVDKAIDHNLFEVLWFETTTLTTKNKASSGTWIKLRCKSLLNGATLCFNSRDTEEFRINAPWELV